MKKAYIIKVVVALLAAGLPLLPVTCIYAQVKQPAGAYTQSQDDADTDDAAEEVITTNKVDKSINNAYRANSPVIRSYPGTKPANVVSAESDIPFSRSLMFMHIGSTQTFDALGNSPVNNNSGAYNPRQSVNMPQSTFTQPPLPYKNGGTYYQANDSLLRPPRRNW